MAANNLGTAYIKIAPQMQGIQKSISDGLAGIKSTSLPGAAALGTVIAKGVSAAMNLVTSSLDKAIERTDIINNFPKVMSNMGISADKAKESIDKLKDKLDGLPTSLQDGASAVQRFTSKNADIKKSTELFLALNNAILAGGAPAELQATAIEQMSQAYAKGKPDMMEWRAIQSAMPAQLRQIAIEMGYGADGVAELGEALRKGDVSMDAFMDTIVKLNTTGANGFQSFEQQAKNSTDGIGTALTNVQNRAAAAIQKVIQSFGSKDVSDAINKFSSSFKGVADWIVKYIVPIIKNQVVPVLKTALGVVKSIVEYIAANKWVQNTIMGIVTAMLAFKAVSTVKSIIVGVITPVVTLTKNLITSVGAFKEAWSAGLSFSSALGNVAKQTTGVTSNIAGMGQTLTASHGAVGGLASKFLGLSAAIGGAVLAYEGIKAMIIIHDTQVTESITKMREYERAHYSVKQAVDSAKRAIDLQKQSIQDLKTAEMAATNAEIAALEYKKQAEQYQSEMNRLKAEGKQNTDDYRLAELQYTQALAQEKQANEELSAAQEQVKNKKTQLDDLNSSSLYKANLVLAQLMKEKGEYGNLAAQLDALSNSTIRYKDEQGNMVESSIAKSQEMASGIAEQLAHGSEAWRSIVDIANREGISLTEACAKYGKQAGSNITGNFNESVRDNVPLLTEGTKAAAEAAINAMKEGTGGSYAVGMNLTQGAADGVNDKTARRSLFDRVVANIKAAIAKMKDAAQERSPSKATAEIGKFMSLGLAKGIDDYADEAVKSAQEMTQKTIDAMSDSAMLNGNIAQFQPQTALTSGMNGSGGQVIQNNEFYVDSELDVKDVSKRLGWQVATAL